MGLSWSGLSELRRTWGLSTPAYPPLPWVQVLGLRFSFTEQPVPLVDSCVAREFFELYPQATSTHWCEFSPGNDRISETILSPINPSNTGLFVLVLSCPCPLDISHVASFQPLSHPVCSPAHSCPVHMCHSVLQVWYWDYIHCFLTITLPCWLIHTPEAFIVNCCGTPVGRTYCSGLVIMKKNSNVCGHTAHFSVHSCCCTRDSYGENKHLLCSNYV